MAPNYDFFLRYSLVAMLYFALALTDMQGIPLPPPSNNNDATIRPLSKEDMNLLDPTAYMSLWELQSSMQSVDAGR